MKTWPRSRLGVALMVVLAVLAALSVIAFYLHLFSTRQRHQSHRLSSGEIALHAAEFGARQACLLIQRSVDFLNSSSPETFPKKSSSAPANLREFLERFATPDGKLKSENLQFLLSNNAFDLLNRTVLEDYPSNLEMKIMVTHETLHDPLWEAAPVPGLKKGFEGEQSSRFIVDVTATLSGVSRRVLGIINARAVHLSWPVLGRFVLFADQVGPVPVNDSLNQVTYTLSGSTPPKLVESFVLDPAAIKPLVIQGGEGVTPTRRRELTSDMTAAARFLNDQGWVLLGGAELTLGLAPGIGEYGEHFLLASDAVYLRDIVHSANPFGFEAAHPDQEKHPGFRFRLWETHEIYSLLTGLFKETRANARKIFLSEYHEADVSRSSLLRLMGTSSTPSPTLVFGQVFRRYVFEQGLRVKTSSSTPPTPNSMAAVSPYIPKEMFDRPQWMTGFDAEVTQVIKETCGNDWEGGYRQAMSFPVRAPFNEGLAFWFAPSLEPGLSEDKRPVFSGFSTGMIQKLGKPLVFTPPGSADKLLFDLHEDRTLWRGDQEVFTGKLQDVLTHIRPLALARCGRSFRSGAELKAFLRSVLVGNGSTVGFYHVEQPFEWTDGWNELLLGGCGIVCDKGVTILGAVEPVVSARFPDAAKNLVTFVALTGDVTVKTDRPVHASLLAPAGKLKVPGGCQIHGLVAVGQLDLSGLTSSQNKSIVYDPAHDWAAEASFNGGYRVMLEQQPVLFAAKPY